MLNWLARSRVDHPMATMKKARQLVVEMLGHDSFKVIEEATSWLDSIVQTEGFKVDYRLELVDLLDRGAKHHQTKLAQEYLEAPRLQKSYETRLWNTSFGFWKMLGSAYLKCVEEYEAGRAGAGAMKKDLPLVVGRALRALAVQLKWLLLRYGLIEERIWGDLGRAYLFAEREGIATQRAAIYPGPHGEASAQEELLKALMFVMSAPDSLSPTRIHIAERTVAHFGGRFSLQAQPAARCRFCFDLSLSKPPARVSKNPVPGSTVRFFGPGDAAPALRHLMLGIEEKDALPDDFNLGKKFEKGLVQPVLAHLEQYWADRPPVRSTRRSELATRITVLPGFAGIVRWVQAVMDTSSLEFGDPEAAESWIVYDMGEGGYGAIVPQVKGDWLRIGVLIGLRPETVTDCRIGVVRRVTRDKYDQRRVGIQALGPAAVPVTLSPAGGAGAATPRAGAPAVLLSNKPDRNGEVAVLMRGGSFTHTHNLEMRVHKAYLLAPAALIESGEEFDWARFKIVKQL